MSDPDPWKDYREVFGREPEPWRLPLGALRLTIHTDPELRYEGWDQRLVIEIEALVEILNAEPGDRRVPNGRHGFEHVHSGLVECGIAYRWEDDLWLPCSKLVNHPGACGYQSNTAF